jgi:hypothetical protein
MSRTRNAASGSSHHTFCRKVDLQNSKISLTIG